MWWVHIGVSPIRREGFDSLTPVSPRVKARCVVLVVPNSYLQAMLTQFKHSALYAPNNKVLCGLFGNNAIPAYNSVASDFLQPEWSGYAPRSR